MNNCRVCRYWTGPRDSLDMNAQGQCRCHAIQIGGVIPQQNAIGQTIPSIISAFPQVQAGEWCGEWKAAEELLQ